MLREKSEYIEHLQEVIWDLHGCQSEHLSTVTVEAIFDGETTWAGEVEVFALDGCAKSKLCYAWSYKYKRNGMEAEQVHALLQIPPIVDVKSAVQAGVDMERTLKQAELEMDAAKKNPWRASREGSKIWIIGFRPFLVKDPIWHFRKEEIESIGDTIAYRFWYELPQKHQLRQAFHRVIYSEPEISPKITRVKIIDEIGQSYLIPIE